MSVKTVISLGSVGSACSAVPRSTVPCISTLVLPQNFSKVPFSNRLKVFYFHLKLPSDQENKNGFAGEGLWFLDYRVESTPFRHLNKFREPRKQCVTHGHVSIKANISGSMLYNMFKRIGIRLASLKVDEILSMGAKETPNVEIPKTNGSILT